jgi:hypothetical protein
MSRRRDLSLLRLLGIGRMRLTWSSQARAVRMPNRWVLSAAHGHLQATSADGDLREGPQGEAPPMPRGR